MEEADKVLMAQSLRYLQSAATSARDYLEDDDEEHAAEVLQIHINFVIQRITGMEKTVSSINRRNKNDEVTLPEEAEEASELVRDLQIKQAKVLRQRKEQERLELAATAAVNVARQSRGDSQVQVVIKKPPLPPLPIPRFAGESMEYSNFVTIFDATVHSNDTLTASQKLAYLQSYVDGEAKRLIGKILVTDTNYEMAREILKTNFGHSSQTISVLYDKLHSVGRARNDPFSVRDTYNEVESILQMLEHAGVEVNADQYLRYEVLKKWPFPLIKQLVRSTDVSLENFRKELKKEVELQIQLTQASGYVQQQPQQQQQRGKPYGDRSYKQRSGGGYAGAPTSGVAQNEKGSSTVPATSSGTTAGATSDQRPQQRSAHCAFCNEQHYAEQCERYKTALQRTEKLGDKRCRKCFRDLHEGTPCIRNMKCRYCPSWDHNRALCPIKYPEGDSKCLLTSEPKSSADPAGCFMTLLAEVSNPETGQKTGMRILIDPACNRTALTDPAAAKIGIKLANKNKTSAKGLGERQVEPMSTEAVQVTLHVRDGEPVTINTRLTSKIADSVPVYDLQRFRTQYPQCSEYFVPPTGDGCPIDMIIGTDRLLRLLTLHKSVYVSQECQLMSTKFGWLVMVEDSADRPEKQNLFNFFTRNEDIVKLMWDLDLVGLKGLAEPDTEHEERALKVFYESIRYVDGRYEIRWPWRTNPPNLNENYGLAMGRLKTLLRKLQQQPQLLKAYHEIIQQQLREGVVEEVPRNSVPIGPVVHYIPHHAVISLDKSTEVRIVYDAAATTGRSRSLNENMLKGTKWLGTTVGSLLRFRKFKKAVTADIRHAFHQIAIAPPDRDAVRFIWVHDVSKPAQGENIRILRFKRVAFGIVASPFLLYATIQFHLRNNQTKYSNQICREMYADNLLISFPEKTDEIEFYDTTKKLFEGMAMNITKWKSNIPKLQNSIPSNDKILEELMSVLGLEWSSTTDKLGLRPPKISHLEKLQPTKRVVLKTMASIFDPLGWVAPFILQIRMFLRKLWQQQKTWESPLAEEELRTWTQLKQEIKLLNSVALSRMYFQTEYDEENSIYEIHTFVDASAEAIGAVSYFRQCNESSKQVAFLMAKTRLSPAAKLSIPRLEFYALLMGVRMHCYVVEALNLQKKPKQYIWSDSKCVLAWVTSNKLLPVAIEKHLGEVRNAGVEQFRYVPTALNPADVASRGATLSDLKSTTWLTGPRWLLNENDWPSHTDETCENEQKLEPEKILFIQGQNTVELPPPFSLKIENFSELKLLLRRTSYCIWLLHHYIKKQVVQTRTPIDYHAARMLWIRWDQRRNGSQNQQLLSSITHFKGVQLFTDQFAVLRCKSRLTNSVLPWTAIEPIILVKGSYLTELIVLDIHQRNFHSGTSQTLATLRKHYWLVHGRREVFRIITKKCFKCRRYTTKPFNAPEIPPLPQFRITPSSHPFENTGLDIFGPVYILVDDEQAKDYKKVKRWILLLTCLVVRAIHLEILNGLDTMDIICALKRFTARRGTPSLILSDNAPQFHLVNGCLQELWKAFFEDNRSNVYFAENSITWKFTPQHAPWMGGAYERLVQVTKNAFRRTYGEQSLTEREFNTTITEIEGVINSRPITYVDKELNSPLLTPNHFLRVATPAIPIDVTERDQHHLSKKERILEYWKAAEKSLNVYWRIWSEQYLLALREIKSKSASSNQLQPKIGDVVLMVDPTQKRGYWRKAIVERLIPSADKKNRSAQIKLATGNRMIRPLVKLAPLELLDVLPDHQQSSLVVSGEDVDVPSTDPSEVDAGSAPVVAFSWSSYPANKSYSH